MSRIILFFRCYKLNYRLNSVNPKVLGSIPTVVRILFRVDIDSDQHLSFSAQRFCQSFHVVISNCCSHGLVLRP